MSAAKKNTLDVSAFTPEQIAQLKSMFQNAPASAPQEPTPQDALSVVTPKAKKESVPEGKKRVRTKRMQKVNGHSVLMYLLPDGKNIRVTCLEDPQEVVLVGPDWAQAKKAAKALTNYVKAKLELRSFSQK